MMGETGDGFSDAVRSFTGQFPLDGSAAAGADLRAKAGLKSLKDGYKFLANSWRQIFGPNAAAELQLQQELTCADIKRPAPDSSSSPLALFYSSRPVQLHTPASAAHAAAVAAQKAAAQDTAGPGSNNTAAAAAAAAAAGTELAGDVVTAACCDVRVLDSRYVGWPMHLDADLLSFGFIEGGYKSRELGLAASALRFACGSSNSSEGKEEEEEDAARGEDAGSSSGAVLRARRVCYKIGVFDQVTQVCFDVGNALVWATADNRKRIKAFMAPKSLGVPRNCDAACNRGKGNGMQLQYTLDAGGAAAGLYVAGTKVLAVASSGALFSWDIAELEPQQHWKVSNRAVDPEASESDDGDTYIAAAALQVTGMTTTQTTGMRTTLIAPKARPRIPRCACSAHPAAAASSSSSSSSGSSQLGPGLHCFAGGTGQSVWAWDLRGGAAQALYELSTGNLDVTALAWHEASSSLIASCSSSYEDLIDYRMEPESDSDDTSDGEERWWPTTAAHGMKDFRAYFVKSRSATLCYTFSSSAAKKVPRSDDC
ncbi:hypothetical protein OEZ85_000638 [Tetradesmus obliquus]|uniref:Uncharacterized protein n=1 Tax=Tetradesmus obliquus TaxID=3088 RepID=A0ABY8UK60_TETOB|nr:hypothetical protein OEZ85_000638 [Tetradesmus obliquus]